MRVGRTYYVSKPEKECNRTCLTIFWVIFAIAVPIAFFSWEQHYYSMSEAFVEVETKTINAPNSVIDKNLVGNLIHVQGSLLKPNEILSDNDFGVNANDALKLRRVTEYCQWVESVIYREDDEGHQIKTYVYTKDWRTTIIPSIFFDQPFAHHNPLRDPFPSVSWSASSASLGPYTVPADVIQNQVNSFKHRISADRVNEQRLPPEFYYIGNGYFYSPYEGSTLGFVTKLAGEWLEGSLLDFQLGDLFSRCNAGDIRVHYEAAILNEGVTLVAKLLDEKGTLGYHTAQNGFQVALVREGQHSIEEIYSLELKDAKFTLLGMRALLFVWAVILLLPFARDFWSALLPAIFLTGAVVGIMWLMIWGATVQVLLVSVLSTAGFAILFNMSQQPSVNKRE
mmetsp:Transcript_17966/g.25089  ORF Transcript_17966/g.25089 Transcript_17966/m.25089 type:complete len:396 (-) Transcript_17966:56-1243(-)